MIQFDGGADQIDCLLAHDMLNKLTAIICHCDLLETERDSEAVLIRAQKIRDLAFASALMFHDGRHCETYASAVISELEQVGVLR